MDILILLKLVWRRKWIILLVPVVTGIGAFFLTKNNVLLYRAEAQLTAGFALPDQVQLTDDKFNPRDVEIKFSNLLATMNSGLLYNLLSYRLILHDLENSDMAFRTPGPNEAPLQPWQRNEVETEFRSKLAEMVPLASSDSLFNIMRKVLNRYNYTYPFLQGALSMKRIPNTDYIRIEFVSENPELSAFAANAYCDELIRYNSSLHSEQSGESAEFLKQLVVQKKADLDDKTETLRIFRSRNGMLDAQQEGQLTMTQITDLEQKRDALKSKIQGLELTIAGLKGDIGNIGNSSDVSVESTGSMNSIFPPDRIIKHYLTH
jgi:polysaccharide biosynthesis transport protein